ncbi:MAG: acetyl-CoA carboxylase biotin carboxyl carrier protein subunit, partial [Oscillospiraceae bacterium]|nr:acetyl-CoA carboxylase biotin carboxyl carrier protein subunit [Oscillospiraceae bacterium]
MKRFNISVNGKSYDVAVEEITGSASAPVQAAAPAPAPSLAPGPWPAATAATRPDSP